MSGKSPLSNEEKQKFAKALYDFKQKNPALLWPICFKEAMKVLPKNKRFSTTYSHPNKLPWVGTLIDELRKNFGFFVTPSKVSENKPSRKDVSVKVTEKPKTGKSKTEKPKEHTMVILTENEKLTFAKYLHEAHKANPGAGTANAIRVANSQMPENRRIGAKINSLNQIPWVKPLLDKLGAQVQSKGDRSKTGARLNDEERIPFAKAVYETRKANPDEGWKFVLQTVNKTLPSEKRFPDALNHPGQIPWIKPLLEKLEKDDPTRLVIDHRHTHAVPTPPTTHVAPPGIKVIPEGVKSRKQRSSRLSNDEKMAYAEAAYQARITNWSWSWKQCLKKANEVLPEHLHIGKSLASPAQISWLPDLLEEISKRPPKVAEPEPEIEQPQYQGLAPALAPAPAAVPTLDIQAMMKEAMEKILREQMAGGVAVAAPVVNTKPAVKAEVPRKKVIVVGLLPVQTNEIQKRFGHKFDFKFIGSNTPNQQIRESIKHGDIGILMTRFVSHPTQAAMRDHPGFTFCNGNSTALENLLEEKLVKLDGQ